MASGTIGTRALAIAKPRPRSRSQACAPDAASRPYRGAAREQDGVGALDDGIGLETAEIAPGGRATGDGDGRHRRLIEERDGDTRGEALVLGAADLEAGDIGEEVAHRGSRRTASARSAGARPTREQRAWRTMFAAFEPIR